MERLPRTEPPVLTDAEQLLLAFARRVGLALTREAQQDLVQEFTIKALEKDVTDIDFNNLLPTQVIDEP